MKTKAKSPPKQPVAKPLKKVQVKQPAAPKAPPEADIPAEEAQSHFNYRIDLALVEFEAKLKRVESVVAELQKLPTAIAPQTQSQTATLHEITGNLSKLE